MDDFKRIADLCGRDLLISDADHGFFVDCNDSALLHLGYSRQELLQLNPEALQADPDHDAAWVAERRAALVAAGGGAFLTRHRCHSGAILEVWISHTIVILEGRRLIVSLVADRTLEQRTIGWLEESIALFGDGERINGVGTWEFRFADGRMAWSPQVHRLCKTDPASYTPTLWGYSTLVHPDDRPRWRRDFQQAINRGDPLLSRHRLAFLDGSELEVEVHGEVIVDEEGQPLRVVATIADVSLAEIARQQLDDLRHRDPLTGLPNKQASIQELQQRLRGRDYGQSLAVLSLDIDGFQDINDSFGPELGDQLLQRIAAELGAILGPRAWLARLSSDEFLVIQHDNIRSLGDAMALARQIEQVWTERPPLVPQLRLNPSLCIGIASYPEHAQEAQALVQCANTALTQAKRSGRGQICAYSSTLSRQIRERLELDGELAQALESQQLRLMIQPQVHRSGSLIGGEVLLRWTNRRGQSIPPSRFIPLAEQSGLIVPLGQWTLERLLERLSGWRERALAHPRLALNISPRQLELPSRRFVGSLLDTLAVHGLAPEQLELEITESVLLLNPLLAREQLTALADQGFRIAIDDFGTGYSSLELLRSLPVHRLKIDQTFIASIVDSPEDQAIVQATITLAHGLGMECIAEGVETGEQRQVLERLGCHQYQGYLYSRPLELEAFEAMLAEASEGAVTRWEPAIRLGSAAAAEVGRLARARPLVPSSSAQLRLLRTALDVGQDEFLLLRAERALDGGVADFRILDANQAACGSLHQERDAVVGQLLLAIVPQVRSSGLFQAYVDALQQGRGVVLENFATADPALFNDERIYDIRIAPVQDCLVVHWQDVTGRTQSTRNFADAAALYRLLAENIVEVVVLLDHQQVIRWVSPSLQPMTGWTPLQWSGRRFPELFASFEQSAQGAPTPVDLFAWMSGYGPIRQGRLRLLQPEGRWGWIELSVRRLQGVGQRCFDAVLRAGDGGITLQDGFVITLNPADGQVLQEQRLLRQATVDPLTGLESRAAILQLLQRRLQEGRSQEAQHLALLFCDFDHFKTINDSHGHAAGDLVLSTTAQRIQATIRQRDHAGRLGGDEFLVLLDDIRNLEQAMVVAEKLLRATSKAVPYGNALIEVSVSIGVALHGAGEDADLFLRRADRSMFAAKSAGRHQVVAL